MPFSICILEHLMHLTKLGFIHVYTCLFSQFVVLVGKRIIAFLPDISKDMHSRSVCPLSIYYTYHPRSTNSMEARQEVVLPPAQLRADEPMSQVVLELEPS